MERENSYNLEWQDDAECRKESPDLFFPERRHYSAVKAAKAVCTRCVVVSECLEYALDNNERFGVWGGMTEEERENLLRRQRRRNI